MKTVREIKAELIKDTVRELFLEANYFIGRDVYEKQELREVEDPRWQRGLRADNRNNEIAAEEKIAICQDTGMAVLFLELGQEVQIVGGDLNEAINAGVKEAYTEGYLRKSIVADPFSTGLIPGTTRRR